MASFRTATEFVLAVENQLGWSLEPPLGKSLWQMRRIEAGKVNKKIKTDPGLYSWENLEITLAYLARAQRSVKTPVSVLFSVEKALAARPKQPRQRPLGDQIDNAIAFEMEEQRPGYVEWVGTLSRAVGPARADVLREWSEAGRGR